MRLLILTGDPEQDAVDFDQRSVELSFQVVGNTLQAQAPSSANLAPPGPYMLFLVNGQGVPSVAPFVQVG